MGPFYAFFLLLLLPGVLLAQPKIGELLSKLERSPSDTNKVLMYGKISMHYRYNRPDSATYYLNQGLVLADELEYKLGKGKLLHQLGLINDIHSNFDLAEKYTGEALQIFKELNYIEGIAISYNSLGAVEGKKGNLHDATKYFFDALKLYKTTNNQQGIGQTYMKLGTLNELSGDYGQALSYYTQAQELIKTGPVSLTYLSLLNNIGTLYGKKGEYAKALQYLEEGTSKSNAPDFASIQISLLTNLGNTHSELKNKAKAFVYHSQSLRKARDIHMPQEEARALINLASILDEDQAALGLRYLDTAQMIAKRIQYKQLIAEVHSAKAEIFERQGQYKNALASLEQKYKLQDSIFTIDKAKEIASLQASYDLEESKLNVRKLKLDNKERTFERNVGVIIIISILIIALILWFYLSRTNNLNKQLDNSNKIKDKLFSVIGHDLRGPVGSITQMLRILEKGEIPASEYDTIFMQLRKQSEISYDILNGMLAWGKNQIQGTQINPTAFHPKEIIAKNIEALQPQAQDKQIAVYDDTDAGLVAYADVDHFDFIIRNLLSNAIKFTYPDGAVNISAKVGDDNTITFSVKDNGTGISEEMQRLFLTSNMQATFGTGGEKGTGLGLLLSKEFVQANNGRIWIESKEGEGSTFHFSINHKVL